VNFPEVVFGIALVFKSQVRTNNAAECGMPVQEYVKIFLIFLFKKVSYTLTHSTLP